MGTKVEIAPVGNPENSSFVTKLNQAVDKLSDEFDKVIYKDGTQPLDDSLDAGQNRIYNLAAPVDDNDAARLIDLDTVTRGPPGPDTLEALEEFETSTGAARVGTVDGSTVQAKLTALTSSNADTIIGTETGATLRSRLNFLDGAIDDLASNFGDTFIGVQSGSNLRVKLAAMDAAIAAASGVGGGDLSIRSELLASTGDTMVNTQSGASLRVKLAAMDALINERITRATKTFLDFGAVGNGSADDTAEVLAALESGYVIDGLGLTYALNAEVHPSSFKGVKNATFKWIDTTAMAVNNRSMIHVENLSDWFVDGCIFDMGTVEDVGASGSPDNARAAFTTTNATYSKNIRFTNNIAFGNGAGTAFELRNVQNAIVKGNIVRDRIVAGAGITNDAQNGIQIDSSLNVVATENVVAGLYIRIAGVLQKKWSRGFCVMSTHNSVFANNNVSFVDQGMDFSGGPTNGGNRGLTVNANQVSDVLTWGIKFANFNSDIVCSGNNIRRFGYAGIVVSSGTADLSLVSQRILINNNYLFDPTGEWIANNFGIFIMTGGGLGAGYPRGITVRDNQVSDTSGGGKLQYGYYNQTTYTGGEPNVEESNVSIGHTTGFQTGFHRRVARATAPSTSVLSGVVTPVTFTAAPENTQGWWNAGSPARFTITEAGVYRLHGRGNFSANSSGFRGLTLRVGGSTIHADTKNAVSGTATFSEITVEYTLSAGAVVELVAEQNSGGTLTLNDAVLQAEFLRAN